MGILLLSVGLVVFVGLLALFIHQGYVAEGGNDASPLFVDIGVPVTLSFICVAVVTLFIAISIALTTTSNVQRYRAFYFDNAGVYEAAVEAVKVGVERAPSAQLIEGPNLQQIQSYAKTVTDLREAVVVYNTGLRSHRYWQDSFWFGLFWANADSELEYISTF